MLHSSTWMSSTAPAAATAAELHASGRLRARLAFYAACVFAVACSAGTYAYLAARL